MNPLLRFSHIASVWKKKSQKLKKRKKTSEFDSSCRIKAKEGRNQELEVEFAEETDDENRKKLVAVVNLSVRREAAACGSVWNRMMCGREHFCSIYQQEAKKGTY